jgi:serine/threonine protein kinase
MQANQQSSSWPYQVAPAVAYIHSLGIIQSALGIHNFLISNDGSLIICDLGGSGMVGLAPTVCSSERYAHPLTLQLDHDIVAEEVFAMGTLHYEVFFAEKLFHGLTDGQIRRNIAEGKFPDLSAVPLPLRKVISDCWRGRGHTVREAMAELSICKREENIQVKR